VNNRPPTTLGARFSEALTFAATIHADQRRKGTQIPYIAHVLGVASLALEYGADEDEAIGALLHDAIEDAPGAPGTDKAAAVRASIRLKFGERVLEIVEGCTDTDADPKPPWRVRKAQYVARIGHEGPSVLLVSMADKLHNVRALQRDYRAVGDALWARFNPEAGREGTLGYYRRLVTAYSERIQQLADSRLPFLVESLARDVSALEELVGMNGFWAGEGLKPS
jgi:(p)ppGpp synthase/HD superfamily hydrolase